MRLDLTDDEKLALAARFDDASRSNNAAAYRAICAPDAVMWHNFDEAEVATEQSVKTIAWLQRVVPDLAWIDIALFPTRTGWVSQSVMTGTAPGGSLRVHSCVIATLNNDGLMTRVEEYLDSAQTAVLKG